ncbi:porin family protein [Bacteroides fragilis]|nr:porin family protein [Bacteroides fragilis]
MKKIVFLLLLCVACCMNAQEFHLIPKVGLNLANTTGEVDSKVRSGLNIGLGGDVMLTERFGIETGVYITPCREANIKGAESLIRINWIISMFRYMRKNLYIRGCMCLEGRSSVSM